MEKREIYIGRNVGKDIMKDLHNAKKNIKIISPYLGPDYINDLIGISEKGVDVSLITSDNVETNNYVDFDHTDIIKQEQYVDIVVRDERNALLTYLIASIITFLLSLFISLALIWNFIFMTFISSIVGFVLYNLYSNKVIYSYEYDSVFKLKIFLSKYSHEENKNDFLVHSKLSIIVDKIAYLGSVNFTYSGIENSFECITKTKSKGDILYLNQEYKKLFYNKRLRSKDINEWGSELYEEPIN